MILRIPSIAVRTRPHVLVFCAVATPHQPGEGGSGGVTTRGRRGGKSYNISALSCCSRLFCVLYLKRMLQVVRTIATALLLLTCFGAMLYFFPLLC